jgi:hypothetical protein
MLSGRGVNRATSATTRIEGLWTPSLTNYGEPQLDSTEWSIEYEL